MSHIDYSIIVRNKTRLENLIERFNTKLQAKFYIEKSGGVFSDYEEEHDVFYDSLGIVQKELSKVIKTKTLDRSFLPSFLFNEKQIVIVIGQDGLVANTAKYVNGIPIMAINPDSKRYDGQLLPFQPKTFIYALENVLKNKFNYKDAFFAEAKLNDGQKLLAFNDLFIGPASHTSARYKISFENLSEEHSSSGIIVSTKEGSTGWLSSVFNMAYGVNSFIEKTMLEKKPLTLENNQLMFAVREPFISKRSKAEVTAGILDQEKKLIIESFMPENGVIFSDGIEADFLKFNSGNIATIGLSNEKARLVLP